MVVAAVMQRLRTIIPLIAAVCCCCCAHTGGPIGVGGLGAGATLYPHSAALQQCQVTLLLLHDSAQPQHGDTHACLAVLFVATGGGCGVGIGLGWGWGAAFGANYIQIDPEFESNDKRPKWLRQLQVSILSMQRSM